MRPHLTWKYLVLAGVNFRHVLSLWWLCIEWYLHIYMKDKHEKRRRKRWDFQTKDVASVAIFNQKCNKCSDFDTNTASVEIFKAKCRKRCDFQSILLIRTKNSWHISVDSALYKDIKNVDRISFFLSSENHWLCSALPPMIPPSRSSRSNISLLFKVFSRGHPLKGFHNVHLHWRQPSSFKFLLFSEGFDPCPFFVCVIFMIVIHPNLFIMSVPSDLELYFSVTFQSWHCSSGDLMKSSKV